MCHVTHMKQCSESALIILIPQLSFLFHRSFPLIKNISGIFLHQLKLSSLITQSYPQSIKIRFLLHYCQYCLFHLYENVHNWQHFHKLGDIVLTKYYSLAQMKRFVSTKSQFILKFNYKNLLITFWAFSLVNAPRQEIIIIKCKHGSQR